MIFLITATQSFAQTKLLDGTWEDKNLSFKIIQEEINEKGFLELCIQKNDICIENLTIGFSIIIFDNAGKEIWSSLWTGKNMRIKFEKDFPGAGKILVKAGAPFVINNLTGTRINTGVPLKIEKLLK
tara:strand:+ start:43401 stop:43781 length:381 start_codon:yes stop_codon:yes gene_type:complete